MQYLFKQALNLGGKDYHRGSVHNMPEKIEYSPIFIKYVGIGLIVEHEDKIISPESLSDRQKRTHDALVKRATEAKAPKAKAPEAPKAPEKSQDEKDAEEIAKMEADEAAAKVEAEKADAEQAADKSSDQGEASEKAEKPKKNKKG